MSLRFNGLADAGVLVFRTDLRKYDENGRFFEAPWSSYRVTGDDDIEGGRKDALDGLERIERQGFEEYNKILITWDKS